jgi:hypothetical protein
MVDGNQVGRNERRQYADQEGVLRYFVDEAGTYRLERAGNPSFGLVVVLKQGQRVAETLHELPLGSVSGVLDWPGAPDRMRVQLEGPGVPLYKSYSLTQFGRFHFDDVSPGTYTLLLSGGGLTKEMQARLDIPKVEVLPGQDCIVTIRLKPEVEPSR